MSPADRPRKSDDVDGGWAKRAARKQETRRDAASGKLARESESYTGSRGAQRKSDSPRKPFRSDRDAADYRGRDDRRFEGKSTRGFEKPGGGKPAGGRAGRESGYGAGRSEAGRPGYGRADRSAQAPSGKSGRERFWDDRSEGRPEARGGDASGRRSDSGAGAHGKRRADDAVGGRSERGGRPAERSSGAKRAGRGEAKTTGTEKDRGSAGKRSRRTVSVDPVREVALEVLRAVRERDAYANLVLPGLLRDRHLSGRDAALATELAYGTCRTTGLLDAVIAHGAGRSVEEIDGPLLDILRLGAYQLLRTRIGAHAAVDTSVALARAEFGAGKSGFVNAVLRRVGEKSAEEWVETLAPADPVGRLAFEYAHPAWIAQAFADALGARAGELRDLLAADDERPVVHLVARPGEITAEELALVTGGEEGRWSPYAVYLEGGDPGRLEPVREGMAAVQDEGSQLVALSLTRAPLEGPDGGRWLDMCAGPGGKAALLGALAAIDRFQVDAVEPAEHRAELVRKATHDLPVRVHVVDGRDSGLAPGYDRILVDAPCTGLGALRRRPEARWRRTPADVRDLVVLQRELLTAAWDLVRPGGVVVYSTCSPHLAETVSIVADHVRRTGAVELDTGELLPGVTDVGDGPAAQLWPHRHGTDAMFMAALRKPI